MKHKYEKESAKENSQKKEAHQNETEGDKGIAIPPPIFQLKTKDGENEKDENTESFIPQFSYDFNPSAPPTQNKENGLKGDVNEVQLQKSPYQLQSDEVQMDNENQKYSELAYSKQNFEKSDQNALPGELKQKSEDTFNSDFSDVAIHSNSTKASDLGALAYTQGSDIHFAPGQYNPQTKDGQELIGHELTHVMQQRNNEVTPNKQTKGVAVNDEPKLENEADEGGKTLASKASSGAGQGGSDPHSSGSMQMKSVGVAQLTDEEVKMVKDLIAGGLTNENILTNKVFYKRHPKDDGRRLNPDLNTPEEQALIKEWIRIRNKIVRPVLGGKGTPVEDPKEEPKKEPKDPGGGPVKDPKKDPAKDPAKEKPKDPKPVKLSVEEALKQIVAACDRIGTDEAAVYSAIRRCSNRYSLGGKAEFRKWIFNDFSGTELWKVHLLIAYGTESNFPKIVKEIWDAISGIGTNNEALLAALKKLNGRDIPGLDEVISSEWFANHDESAKLMKQSALIRHKENVKAMGSMIAELKASSALIDQNTADWLNAGKNNLHVCTKTHDAVNRAIKHGKGRDQYAYFGADKNYPAADADYELDINSKKGIYFRSRYSGATHSGKDIYVYEAARAGDYIKRVLVHEIQHDSDRHHDEDKGGHGKDRDTNGEAAWNGYKTEFRAYWMDGRYDKVSDKHDDKLAPFDNARQKKVFENITGSPLYAYTKKHYDDNTEFDGKKFKDLVHGYTRPEGINLINSPRIDDFYRALEKCKKTEVDETKDPLKAMLTAAGKLDENDIAAGRNKSAARLHGMIKTNLNKETYKKIVAIYTVDGKKPDWA